MIDSLVALDKKLFVFFQENMRSGFMDFFMTSITEFNNWKIPIALFLLSLVIWGGKKGRIVAGLALIVFLLADQMSSNVIKPLFSRARPYMYFTDILPLVNSSPRYSFPSTHATNIFATMFLLSFYYRKFILLNLFIAVAVSFSRVYVGVHYPSDIVAGAILGIACAVVVICAERLVNKKFPTIRLFSAENKEEPKADKKEQNG